MGSERIRVHAQLAQPFRQPLGALLGGFGALLCGFGALLGGFGALLGGFGLGRQHRAFRREPAQPNRQPFWQLQFCQVACRFLCCTGLSLSVAQALLSGGVCGGAAQQPTDGLLVTSHYSQ